jgi:hypothetical protein
VYARIIATNYLGSSDASDSGNGAIILNHPDAPLNLQNNIEVTWGTTIGLEWDEGDTNSGGIPVLDYTIMSKNSVTNTYAERQVGVEATSITLDGFNLGTVYTFKVKSRNALDFSLDYSNEVEILAA